LEKGIHNSCDYLDNFWTSRIHRAHWFWAVMNLVF
jgi:hypothetical protein